MRYRYKKCVCLCPKSLKAKQSELQRYMCLHIYYMPGKKIFLPLRAEAQEPKHRSQNNLSVHRGITFKVSSGTHMQVHNTKIKNLLASHIICIRERLTVCRTLTFTQSAEGPISTTMVSVLDAEKPICPSLPRSTSIEATIFYLLNYLFICCVRIFSRKINWIKLIISCKQDNQQMQLQWHSTSSQRKCLIFFFFFHWYILTHTPHSCYPSPYAIDLESCICG